MGDGSYPLEQIEEHVRSLEVRAIAHGLEKRHFLAKKGDVLVWHADLVHGGSPGSHLMTRKSIVTHYCPKHIAPLFSEWRPVKIYHHDGHLFTTSYYVDFDPVGRS